MSQSLRVIRKILQEDMARDHEMTVQGRREDEASNMAVKWLPEESALIMRIEVQALNASTPEIMAKVTGWKPADKHHREFKVIQPYHPSRLDNQPYLEAVLIGGANPGRGPVLIDSGAAFSMMTEKVAEVHRLKMQPYRDTFNTASSKGP